MRVLGCGIDNNNIADIDIVIISGACCLHNVCLKMFVDFFIDL